MGDRTRVWAEVLSAQYRTGGVLLNARHGEFDQGQAETFCDALDGMDYPRGPGVEPDVVREFVSRIWHMPLFLRSNLISIARSSGDIVRYRAFLSDVTRAVHRILTATRPMYDRVGRSSTLNTMLLDLHSRRGIRRADFLQVATAVLGERLGGLGFRRTSAGGATVRYESALVFVTVKFRRHDEEPSLAIGVLDDPRRPEYPIGDLLRMLMGRHESDQIFIDRLRGGDMREHLTALVDIATVNCPDFLKGDPDTIGQVKRLHAQRNADLAKQILACSDLIL